MARLVCAAALGPCEAGWAPPSWLLPHQITAATRVTATLRRFRGALLCDAVGMGKTYIALAIALGYRRVAVAVPAILAHQWRRTSQQLGVPMQIVSHEALSRSTPVPTVDLLVIDEAHRFRNPRSRRYDRVARRVGRAHVLLVTAVPVVNRSADLLSLVRLFLPDDGLAAFRHGVHRGRGGTA